MASLGKQQHGGGAQSSSYSSSWRTRDMAHEILSRRAVESSSHHLKGSSNQQQRPIMPMSSQFDVDTTLVRIRRDKSSIVRNSFEAGAVALLEKIIDNHDDEITGGSRSNVNVEDSDEEIEDVDEEDLPPILNDLTRIQILRESCMERAHDNKDASKRKTTKQQQQQHQDSTAGAGVGAGNDTAGVPSSTAGTGPSSAGPAASSVSAGAATATGGKGTAGGPGKGTTAGATSGPGTKGGKKNQGKIKADKNAPKFTRNTPASSAAALDARLTSSRAILCTAANVVFEALTPSLPGAEIDVTDVPQNPNRIEKLATSGGGKKISTVNNMGAVIVEAQTVGQRIENVADNASRRASRRYQYRKDNLRYGCQQQYSENKNFLQVKNPFAWKDDDEDDDLTDHEDEDDDDDFDIHNKRMTLMNNKYRDQKHVYDPNKDAMTDAWVDHCRPRLMSVLHTGVGHAIYHDVSWTTRHGRIANMLQEIALEDQNFGLHLIVTVEPDVERFAKEFRGVNDHLRLMSTVNTESIRCLQYTGNTEQKRRLRKRFNDGSGLPDSPFHVVITSYANFLQDYLHFCQVPFEVVVIDDGAAWMAAANGDSNSPIGTLWDGAIWSKSDHQMGLAGSIHNKDWDFTKDKLDEQTVKDAWIGLTARHRVMTSSSMRVQQKTSADNIPIGGLINFVLPHYTDATREEWDRSRITTDANNMKHFRRLLTRSTVVHDSDAPDQNLYKLALQALHGELPVNTDMDPVSTQDRYPDVPDLVSDDSFVSDGKIAHSRRGALQWLGPIEESWLRYELGTVSFKHILDAMKTSANYGHLCEEIVTASSTTSSGQTGQVTGTLAYRLALRCGRHFGSEQGLRQHYSALHAPPGTWLCRTCSTDCVTSQARTHHERSCGQQNLGAGEKDGAAGAPTAGGAGSTKGKAQSGPVGVVGKKNKPKNQQASSPEEKDEDGSIRVPGYRGVWVNQAGKYFVKINKKRLQDDTASDTLYFDNADEAAKKHDSILKEKSSGKNLELNFKEDGSRIVYEDVTTSSTSGLGGSAASVVPALSVINIKDLPPDVKPLLRDPRQTSRTGGNSKRHVYAYRGVCRQARKGHDRWQSQISFMGVNHYLGTFDSEWDAAAIYAWAHLILYGEEATRQAQKEGEEAAAAYEQEKRDIAEGKIPAAPPKPEKKKAGRQKKKGTEGKEEGGEDGGDTTKRKRTAKDDAGGEKKKPRGGGDKESLAPIIAKSVSRAAVLAPRAKFSKMSDAELSERVAVRLMAVRQSNYCVSDIPYPPPIDEEFRPCVSLSTDPKASGGAMLLGLSASLFGWSAQVSVANMYFESEQEANTATAALEAQYGEGGFNENFRTLVQGTVTILGCACSRTQRVYESMGLGEAPNGGAIGNIDCNIGGNAVGCSEAAAVIRYMPTPSGDFQFSALADDDVVTMNGQRITPDMGSFPLFNEDICTVGPRVFVFLLPSDA